MSSPATRNPVAIGRYRVLETLLSGDTGAVYRCSDPWLAREVAILVHWADALDEPSRAAVLRGQRLLATFRHPNIVTIHDAGTWEGNAFQVLELIDGRSIAEIHRGGGHTTMTAALGIGMAVAEALHYVHACGVLHGDVKPANVVLRSTGEPVLVDFGLAVLRSTSTGMDRDLAALGGTLLCILTGTRWPDAGDSDAVQKELRERLEELAAGLPAYVVDVLHRCFAPSTEGGYRDAAELAAALELAAERLDQVEGGTTVASMPPEGQTVVLQVERREHERPGSYREYRLDEHISEGAFGDVYRATDRLDGGTLAIKILKRRWVADRATVERFRREAIIMSRFTHPHIVKVHNFGRYGRSFFIAMEYLDGPTLLEIMKEGPCDVVRAVDYLGAILSGLALASDAGIVHRDLKPSNIKVVDGRVVLFDFGVARVEGVDALTQTGAFIGTVKYAAPEQLRGAPATPATDIWAAGVILYELLAGTPPHKANNVPALMLAIATEAPAPLESQRSGLPPALVDLAHRMLARAPEHRPTAHVAASELAVALGL